MSEELKQRLTREAIERMQWNIDHALQTDNSDDQYSDRQAHIKLGRCEQALIHIQECLNQLKKVQS